MIFILQKMTRGKVTCFETYNLQSWGLNPGRTSESFQRPMLLPCGEWLLSAWCQANSMAPSDRPWPLVSPGVVDFWQLSNLRPLQATVSVPHSLFLGPELCHVQKQKCK